MNGKGITSEALAQAKEDFFTRGGVITIVPPGPRTFRNTIPVHTPMFGVDRGASRSDGWTIVIETSIIEGILAAQNGVAEAHKKRIDRKNKGLH